ncbi:hypothetical protein MK852_19535 [Shewanella benthica]|nr:hypothetical protein [Shewanella benthica]
MEQEYISDAHSFDLGVCVVTQGIHQLQTSAVDTDKDLRPFINRHLSGDWGNTPDEDKMLNDEATKNGSRIMSSYLFNGKVIWIITEADRSVTTILLPSEY